MTPKRLRAKAIDLLARRDHSEKELEDKLRSRGGEEDDVAEVLRSLRDIGLLDDRRFARAFLSFRSGNAWGPRRYRQELISRGISREIVDEIFQEVEDEAAGVPDDKLRLLVERELLRGREPQKVMASLVRRGFGYAEVQDVFRRLRSDELDFRD
jgi:regulatory protein